MRRACDVLRPVTQQRGVAFLLNDRPDLAAETGCDGVHVGQKDAPYAEARRLLGADRIVGVTCHDSRDLAIEAAETGADYVAFGAFYPTTTKPSEYRPAPDLLEWWSDVMTVPCVAIGGITRGELRSAGRRRRRLPRRRHRGVEPSRGARRRGALVQSGDRRGGAEVSEAIGIAVRLDDRGAAGVVAELTIANPGKLNILNRALMDALIAASERLALDERLRAVVLRGAGEKAFIGGADIREMAELEPATAAAFITRLHEVCDGLRRLPVPVIARIDGYALGAGLEVAASCDLRVASDRSLFGMPEVNIGIPSVIEAALLPALIGWGRTRELLLTGMSISAAKAQNWGLVERVVPAAELDAEVEAILAAILACGPQAIRQQKALIRYWEDHTVTELIARGIASFAESFEGDEPRRLMRGFLAARRLTDSLEGDLNHVCVTVPSCIIEKVPG